MQMRKTNREKGYYLQIRLLSQSQTPAKLITFDTELKTALSRAV